MLREEGPISLAKKIPAGLSTIDENAWAIRMKPSEVRDLWRNREGEYDPEYYAVFGSNEVSECLGDLLVERVDRDAAILEIGCSAGRHLAHLHDRGFRNLHGIEINPESTEMMQKVYPELSADVTLHVNAVEDCITEFADRQFDIVFAVETLEVLPSESEWVFDEIPRITSDTLFVAATEQHETGVPVRKQREYPFYYRDYEETFIERGLHQEEKIEGEQSEHHDTDLIIRVFRVPD